jgi:hypothetical protein
MLKSTLLFVSFFGLVGTAVACGSSNPGSTSENSSLLIEPLVCKGEYDQASALMQSKASGWSNLTCQSDSDCTLGPLGPSCVGQGCGGTLVNRAGLVALDAAIEEAESMICTSQCTEPAPPCALLEGNPQPACVAGKCMMVPSTDAG